MENKLIACYGIIIMISEFIPMISVSVIGPGKYFFLFPFLFQLYTVKDIVYMYVLPSVRSYIVSESFSSS